MLHPGGIYGRAANKRESTLIVMDLGNQNSLLVKRAAGGGIRLSRDPLNLTNIHSRKVCFPMPGKYVHC